MTAGGEKMLRHALAGWLLLSVAWTSLGLAGADAHEPILIDPSGDAYDASASSAYGWASASCGSSIPAPPAACPPEAPAPLPSQGSPAPPGTDIVALHFEETPRELIVEIRVARLDAGLSDIVPMDGQDAFVRACWVGGDAGAAECVGAWAIRHAGRISFLTYAYRQGGEGCGDIQTCVWPVASEVVPGAPGAIRFDVPRALLSDGGAGAQLADASVVANFNRQSSPSPGGQQWRIATPLRSPSGVSPYLLAEVDAADGGRTFTFATQSASTWRDLARTTNLDGDVDAENPDRVPDVDIRQVDIVETDETITLSAVVERVNASAPDVSYRSHFVLANGPSMFISASAQADGWSSEITACGDVGCSYTVRGPGQVQVVDGEPGWVNYTVDRADLGYPAAGTVVSAYYFGSTIRNTTSMRPVAAAEVEAVAPAARDIVVFGPHYALERDGVRRPAAEGQQARGALVRDVAGDAATRADVDTSAGMYDIVLAAAEGTSPTTTRVTIGVRDLSGMTVPLGWKAAVYTAALKTERGDYIVGFYRDATKGEFFCASDTLAFADRRSDPAESAWTLLEGVLTVGQSGTTTAGSGGGAGGPSTLTIFAPHSCFGTDAPGEIEASALVGGIHLVPESPVGGVPLEEIWLADEARDENVTAYALGTPVAAAAWYARPFGIDGFWDITGILLAIALPLGGILVVRRKRNALQRYMEEIDRAVGAHPEGSKARDAALVGIRRRLRDDMVRGRIREGHYMLVDARLAEHLRQARMHELTEAFGDLPHRLLQKLLEILADGQITREEARRFVAMLEDSGLTTDAKERVRRKLDLWTVEDAAA